MAPNSTFFDNDNENSIDPNPYAYPYFHSNESTPLLYHLIVTHFGNTSDPLLLNHYQSLLASTSTALVSTPTPTPTPASNEASSSSSTAGTDTGSDANSDSTTANETSNMTMIHSEKTIARRRKFIARRIQSRCQVRPQEAKWVDSCGENALFRFCQLIRFRMNDNHNDNDHNHHHNQHTEDLSIFEQPDQLLLKQKKLKFDSTAELIFFVFNCFIDIDSNALSTLNKWGETPLHQFVGHCGFFIDYHHRQHDHHHPDMNNDKEKSKEQTQHYGLSYLFLEAMLKASPNTVHQTNFQSALPLHLACSLSQLNSNQPFSSGDSMVSMDKFFSSFSTMNSLSQLHDDERHGQDQGLNQNQDLHQYSMQNQHYYHCRRHAKDHSKIIQRLVEYYPKGVLAIDINGCTPLFRAVDSIHCSSDVVSFLLCEMEDLFIRTQKETDLIDHHRQTSASNFDYGDMDVDINISININDHEDLVRSTTAKFLFYKAIMGFKKKNEIDNRYSQYQMKTKNETKKVLSPMEALWKSIVIRRQVKYTIPWLEDDDNAATVTTTNSCASIAEVIEAALKRSGNDSEALETLTQQFGNIWRKVMHLICCAFHGSMKVRRSGVGEIEQNLLAVHASIFCAAPTSVLKLLLRLYPGDLLKRDINGNTPLMMAISSPSFEEQWQDKSDGDEKISNLRLILQASTEAAAIPDIKGHLPLHLAIERSMNWEEGVRDLFMANPGASCVKDPKTRLFPFMLTSSNGSYTSSTDRLTNTYLLLRADPSVLNIFVS
jgi:hypothetical protein